MKPYHQYPLDVERHTLTTFITPFGHFKHLRVPYSLSSIADHSNYCIAEVRIRVGDDIVISDKDEVIYVEHVRQFIQPYKDRKIALNKDKWKYFQSKVTCRLSTIARGLSSGCQHHRSNIQTSYPSKPH